MKPFHLFVLILLTACSENSLRNEKKYFDLEKYFLYQADSLERNKAKLIKSILKNGQPEIREFENTDWDKELQPFIACDINKPAWINSYAADTVISGDTLQIRYTAKEDNLAIKNLEVNILHGVVRFVLINKMRKNIYYHSVENYFYYPVEGYKIEGSQKIRFRDEINYVVSCKFVQR